MKKLSNKKGFTLIEMLIVVAIVAILAAVAVPNFGDITGKTQTQADKMSSQVDYTNSQAADLLDDIPEN